MRGGTTGDAEIVGRYINAVLGGGYKNAGFKIVKTETLASMDWPELQTSWAMRLKGNPSRSLIRIVAEAV